MRNNTYEAYLAENRIFIIQVRPRRLDRPRLVPARRRQSWPNLRQDNSEDLVSQALFLHFATARTALQRPRILILRPPIPQRLRARPRCARRCNCGHGVVVVMAGGGGDGDGWGREGNGGIRICLDKCFLGLIWLCVQHVFVMFCA